MVSYGSGCGGDADSCLNDTDRSAPPLPPPPLTVPRGNVKPRYLFDVGGELVPRIILPDVKFHVRVHR